MGRQAGEQDLSPYDIDFTITVGESPQSDLLQLLLDKAASRNESTFAIAQRLLAMNLAAIQTSSEVSPVIVV